MVSTLITLFVLVSVFCLSPSKAILLQLDNSNYMTYIATSTKNDIIIFCTLHDDNTNYEQFLSMLADTSNHFGQNKFFMLCDNKESSEFLKLAHPDKLPVLMLMSLGIVHHIYDIPRMTSYGNLRSFVNDCSKLQQKVVVIPRNLVETAIEKTFKTQEQSQSYSRPSKKSAINYKGTVDSKKENQGLENKEQKSSFNGDDNEKIEEKKEISEPEQQSEQISQQQQSQSIWTIAYLKASSLVMLKKDQTLKEDDVYEVLSYILVTPIIFGFGCMCLGYFIRKFVKKVKKQSTDNGKKTK